MIVFCKPDIILSSTMKMMYSLVGTIDSMITIIVKSIKK